MNKSNMAMTVAIAIGVGLSGAAQATESSKSKALVELRLRVDEKEQQLEDLRSRITQEKYALQSQIADLKVLLGKERVRRQTLSTMASEQRDRTEQRRLETARFRVPALQAAKVLAEQIKRSLPFKRDKRLGAVNDIIADLEQQRIDATTALSRMWRVVEDELQLTEEVGLHQQVISLNDQTVLADVIHIGMSALYFRVNGTTFGQAVKTKNGDFIFTARQDSAFTAAMKTLFEAMEKQIRQGTFDLRLPPVENGN